MLHVSVICVGNLKETWWRDAAAEYVKRLSAFCRIDIVELKEAKVPDEPSDREISTALEKEADAILAAVSPRAVCMALCIEGKQFTSEEWAKEIENAAQTGGELALIIGSSHGLSPRVKEKCRIKVSFSKMTFPHQMARVILLESLYRAMTITRGIPYHK